MFSLESVGRFRHGVLSIDARTPEQLALGRGCVDGRWSAALLGRIVARLDSHQREETS